MATARMRRVNEAIREILAGAIATELKDPRIGFVTVTDVDTSPDLRAARVYVSVLGSEEDRPAVISRSPPVEDRERHAHEAHADADL